MGLHTWMYRDKDLFLEELELGEKLHQIETGQLLVKEEVADELYHRLCEISILNNTEFEDAFRTDKRNVDGTYTTDVIFSKSECDQWLIDNASNIWYLNRAELDAFWEKYPNGVIEFI